MLHCLIWRQRLAWCSPVDEDAHVFLGALASGTVGSSTLGLLVLDIVTMLGGFWNAGEVVH